LSTKKKKWIQHHTVPGQVQTRSRPGHKVRSYLASTPPPSCVRKVMCVELDSGPDLGLVWTWSGPGLDLVWTWSGPGPDQVKTRVTTRSRPGQDQVKTKSRLGTPLHSAFPTTAVGLVILDAASRIPSSRGREIVESNPRDSTPLCQFRPQRLVLEFWTQRPEFPLAEAALHSVNSDRSGWFWNSGRSVQNSLR
jgi:hypothetical protein